jgi:peroxiredoxin
VQIVPVLAQKAEAVRRYIEETGLPFNILIDESREVVKAYGVWHRVGLDAWNIARPALFLIDTSGRIRYSFVADRQHEFPSHEEIRAALKAMQSSVPTPGPRPEAES